MFSMHNLGQGGLDSRTVAQISHLLKQTKDKP